MSTFNLNFINICLKTTRVSKSHWVIPIRDPNRKMEGWIYCECAPFSIGQKGCRMGANSISNPNNGFDRAFFKQKHEAIEAYLTVKAIIFLKTFLTITPRQGSSMTMHSASINNYILLYDRPF